MDKWLKTETLKRSASRTEIRTTDLAAMGITVDQKDDNHEVQRPTDWPVLWNRCSVLICVLVKSMNREDPTRRKQIISFLDTPPMCM
ncbi:hypothetical protein AVEN_106072-1 [Araneus ventricosus]|uniref:Uncharacterized protein n=1 Tax=Araneus ventricosus TaxID=182803 RepID=A0A4Y2UCN7_ARAVE|nr:hypothetical protein AVEN_106072-1 [Araneus ventricosus]